MQLAAHTPIDLQLHTLYSDGTWTPEALIDHLQQAGFGAAAITDHDRVDTVASLQTLARDKWFLLLPAVEMSADWQGEPVDVLCYGFDSLASPLRALADDLLKRQQENIRQTVQTIAAGGYPLPDEAVTAILEEPAVRQPHSLVKLVKTQGYSTPEKSAGRLLLEAGLEIVTMGIRRVVEATHQSGGVCLIAHPGRGDGYIMFDRARLDQLREETPIDGLEVMYPAHTPEQVTLYRTYAEQHNLLTSAGSDSHTPDNPPIPYPAETSRALLERLGVRVL